MTYKQHRIGEHCQVGDGAHGSLKRTDNGIPYLTARDIKGGRIDTAGAYRIDEATFAKNFRRDSKALTLPLAGDVVFGIIGSLGQAYCVKAGDRFGMSSSIAMLRPNQAVLDSGYLYYWVAGPQFQAAIYAIKGGVAQSYISLEMIRSLPLLVPPLSRQREIVAVLSAYDDLIENNTRRIAILEEMARRIYEEWFVRFRFPGHEGVRMVESELGLVPEGWSLRRLDDLVDDVREGVNPDAVATDTPYVGLEHIPRRSIALAEWGQAADVASTKLRFREGDILFGKIRPYFHKVVMAPVAGVASSDAIVIRAKRAQDFGLALAVVSSDAFVAHATQTSNGTKMPRANWGVLRQYPVPTPPRALQAQFEQFMSSVAAAAANHVLRNRNLGTTRDLLLPKLISGELDVTAVPEPEALAA